MGVLGAVFNFNSSDLANIFRREIGRYSNNTKDWFQLDGRELIVESSNSFLLARQCMYKKGNYIHHALEKFSHENDSHLYRRPFDNVKLNVIHTVLIIVRSSTSVGSDICRFCIDYVVENWHNYKSLLILCTAP